MVTFLISHSKKYPYLGRFVRNWYFRAIQYKDTGIIGPCIFHIVRLSFVYIVLCDVGLLRKREHNLNSRLSFAYILGNVAGKHLF